MSSKNFDIYFDYGSSKSRAAAINKSDIKKNFYCESNFYLNHSEKESEIEKIISTIEKNTNEYLDNINLMFDSSKIISVSLSLKKNLDGSKLKKEDVQFVIQDAKQQILRNYSNQSIIHIVIQNYKINNENYSYLPGDIDCNSLSIDIVFICLAKKIVSDLKIIFSKFDISLNQIFISSYTKAANYKDNFISSKNLSFIDMGFNKTSVTSYYDDQIIFFEVIPVGSNHVTKDISKILNIDLTTAEKIKLNFDADDNYLEENKISFDLVENIIFARLEEILELCNKPIQQNKNLDTLSKLKIVLTGEGSKILNDNFKNKISFSDEIDLLEETPESICESALKLNMGINRQEVVVVPKKQIKEGFFEKLFHMFE
tara:strand:+ start:22 stop:1137 length:1116 start_codon:yes stop_codon:yes gene_type:complete